MTAIVKDVGFANLQMGSMMVETSTGTPVLEWKALFSPLSFLHNLL